MLLKPQALMLLVPYPSHSIAVVTAVHILNHFPPPRFCSRKRTCFLTAFEDLSMSPDLSAMTTLIVYAYRLGRTSACSRVDAFVVGRKSCSSRSWPWRRGARLSCAILLAEVSAYVYRRRDDGGTVRFFAMAALQWACSLRRSMLLKR